MRSVRRDAFVTLLQLLHQEALPVDVKLFDVDVNDAAVAAHLVNVTSVPALILIPPLRSQSTSSHASCTVCVLPAPILPAQFALTRVTADTLGRLLCTTALTLSKRKSCSCLRGISSSKHTRDSDVFVASTFKHHEQDIYGSDVYMLL
jgi:hypothetical protein